MLTMGPWWEPLLAQIAGETAQFTADRAYDGEPNYAALATRNWTSPW